MALTKNGSMALFPFKLLSPVPDGRTIPREFVQQFKAEHLHRLRQRVFWYCVAVLGLLVLSITRIGLDLTLPPEAREHMGYIALRIVAATALLVSYVSVTLYILPAHRGREQIIKAYSLLIITTTLVLTLAMPRVDNGRFVPGAEPNEFGMAAVAQQGVTLFFILLLHLIASLLVELSPRHGLRIYVPMLVIYAAGLLIDPYLSAGAKIRFAVIAPLLGLPGLLWSLWRHRAFTDRFVNNAMAMRYAQVSRELSEARRVHEAMLPPPVTSGGVRVRYRYEPMLDIGGDFLYIHPLTAQRAPTEQPISVVVIDVTGHGFPAALAVNRLYVELTRAFVSSDDPSPAHVIAELNRAMVGGLMPAGIFATAIALRVRELDGGRVLEWCGAGHPEALLRTGDGRNARLASTSPMLGVLEAHEFECANAAVPVRPGDRVVAYTDGVMEARGASGADFGMARIEEAIAGAGTVAANGTEVELGSTLFEAVTAFRLGPTLDDVLIVELVIAE